MRGDLLLVVGSILALAACSDHTGPDEAGNDVPPTASAGVDVVDDQFRRASVRVLEGGTVTWTWRGGNLHNVTFTGGPASATQAEGTFVRTFDAPGVFNYRCTVHGQVMSGTVTVVAPAADSGDAG